VKTDQSIGVRSFADDYVRRLADLDVSLGSLGLDDVTDDLTDELAKL
jgi:hypothetical protein